MTRREGLGLALLAALVLFTGLGQDRLMRMDDEGLYVRIAMEMFARRDWTVPTWFGDPAWYKPPMLYWSMFPWFAMLGPGLLAGRMAALLWGALTLGVTVAFGVRTGRTRAGLASGLLLLTSASFVKYSRVGMMEAPLMFFYLATLYAAFRAYQGDGRRWCFLWPTLAGFSCLVKGPVTGIILGMTLLLFSGLRRDWAWWRAPGTLAGMLCGLLGVVLWPLMALARGELGEWWTFFIVRENLGKFDNIFYSPLNIWGMFLGHMAPWSLLFLFVLVAVLRSRQWREPAVLLNLLFIATLLTFFTLPATRLSWYSVPALPEAALLMGLAIDSEVYTGRGLARGMAVLLALVAIFVWVAPRAMPFDLSALPGIMTTGLSLLVASACLWQVRWLPAAVALATAYIGLGFIGTHWPFEFVSDYARYTGDEVLYVVRLSPYAWSFEFGHMTPQITTEPEVQAAVRARGLILISQSDLDEFSAQGLTGYGVETSWPVLKRRLPLADIWAGLRDGDTSRTQEKMLVISSAAPL